MPNFPKFSDNWKDFRIHSIRSQKKNPARFFCFLLYIAYANILKNKQTAEQQNKMDKQLHCQVIPVPAGLLVLLENSITN